MMPLDLADIGENMDIFVRYWENFMFGGFIQFFMKFKFIDHLCLYTWKSKKYGIFIEPWFFLTKKLNLSLVLATMILPSLLVCNLNYLYPAQVTGVLSIFQINEFIGPTIIDFFLHQILILNTSIRKCLFAAFTNQNSHIFVEISIHVFN